MVGTVSADVRFYVTESFLMPNRTLSRNCSSDSTDGANNAPARPSDLFSNLKSALRWQDSSFHFHWHL